MLPAKFTALSAMCIDWTFGILVEKPDLVRITCVPNTFSMQTGLVQIRSRVCMIDASMEIHSNFDFSKYSLIRFGTH